MVYVINMHGEPLMPCSNRKARLLLKTNKAKVKTRTPFTIQLLYGSYGYKQPIILGVDAGSKTIGLSAATETKELFAAEVTPRNDVVELLSSRREFRRSRRSRTTRYRAPRFNNRVHSKHKGWLAPSVEVKIQEHITSIKHLLQLLPVTKVVVETAEFDLQLLKALETATTIKLHVHHIESRKIGGDAPDNLITLCEHCHDLLHKGLITIAKALKRKTKSTRDAAFMGIMRKTLMQRLRNELKIPVEETKGYITKYTRVEVLKLPKSHTNDALAIAVGLRGHGVLTGPVSIERTDKHYLIKPVRHHNRQTHKATINKNGVRKLNQAPKYVKGFRLFDKVLYNNTECFIWGRRSSGSFLLKDLNNKTIKDGVSYKKLKLLERSSSYLIQ